jgi:CTP:molybdopterin cytidylyltransferase MocA
MIMKGQFPQKLHVVVLAGTDRNPKRLIDGQNKALLPIGGRALVRIVVDALLQAEYVDRIIVVGPVKQLSETLSGLSERVILVEQVGKMMRNAWAGVRACGMDHAGVSTGQADAESPMLLLTCDLPLLTAASVDDFVLRCRNAESENETRFALHAGIAEEASLTPYYAMDGKPGIIRPYVEFHEGRYRLANIYVCRPHGLSHQDLLDTGFSYRKAKDWRNVMKLAWSFVGRAGGWRAMWFTLRLQATLMAARRKGWLYRKLRSGNTERHIEGVIGELLGGSVHLVDTPYGGISLDVDEDEDYRVLTARFDDWMRIQAGLETRPHDGTSPAGGEEPATDEIKASGDAGRIKDDSA